MIDHIVQNTKDGKTTTTVFYEVKKNLTRRVSRYEYNDNLPTTVTMFLLNASRYEKKYTMWGKIERYYK